MGGYLRGFHLRSSPGHALLSLVGVRDVVVFETDAPSCLLVHVGVADGQAPFHVEFIFLGLGLHKSVHVIRVNRERAKFVRHGNR